MQVSWLLLILKLLVLKRRLKVKSLTGGISLLDTVTLDGDQVITSSSSQNQGQENGLRLRELPENTANIWNNFQVNQKLGLGLGVTYQDASFADNGNNTTLPSFVRVDAAAYYELNDKLRLQMNVENLTDTDYFPSAHTANNITVGAPINARFSVIGRF